MIRLGARQCVNKRASAGLTRQITNVAAGTQATDAVNVAQLDSAINSIGAPQNVLPQAENYTNAVAAKVEREAFAGVAAAMAMPSVPNLDVGQHWIGMRMGSYGGQQALGTAFAWAPARSWTVSGDVTSPINGGPVGVSGQVGYIF
jgi:autotransporter adhesin